MRTQIYTMQTIEEAQAVVALGVDHVGITPGNYGLPGEVDFATARAIVDAIGNSAVSVALSVESNLDAIESMVQAVRPDILHLCGLENVLLPDAVRTLRGRLSNVVIMQAVSVAGPRAIDVALAYQDVAEYLILDTQAPDIVAEAINVVQPWGVDSLTHTNRPLPGGGFHKDLDRIRQFVMAAQGVC